MIAAGKCRTMDNSIDTITQTLHDVVSWTVSCQRDWRLYFIAPESKTTSLACTLTWSSSNNVRIFQISALSLAIGVDFYSFPFPYSFASQFVQNSLSQVFLGYLGSRTFLWSGLPYILKVYFILFLFFISEPY